MQALPPQAGLPGVCGRKWARFTVGIRARRELCLKFDLAHADGSMQIRKVEKKIEKVESQIEAAEAAGDKEKEAQLREKEKQLREKEKQLREKELIGMLLAQ